MNRARVTTVLLVVSIAAATAMGSANAAPSAERSTSAVAGGRDPAGANRTVEAGGGLVTFVVPRGWDVTDRATKVPPHAFLRLEEEWSLDNQPVHELAKIANGDVSVALGAEPLYEVVDEETWSPAVLEVFTSRGATFNIQAPGTWAGNSSTTAIGELDGGYLRVDLADVDGQLLIAVTQADEVPTDAEQRAVTAFLDSVEVDDSVFGPLQNGIDARLHVAASETGAGDFTVSTLMPVDWVQDSTAEVGQLFVGPEADSAFVQFVASLDEDGLEGEIQRELDDFATEDFFGKKTKRQKITRDGVPLVVIWDGNPKTANAAAVYGTDGVIFFAAYLVTDDDNELLHGMVDKLLLLDHNA
jgi:hypothetical protein